VDPNNKEINPEKFYRLPNSKISVIIQFIKSTKLTTVIPESYVSRLPIEQKRVPDGEKFIIQK
jgi:hypothetical protein